MLHNAVTLPPSAKTVPGYFRYAVAGVVALLVLHLAVHLLFQSNDDARALASDAIAVVGPLFALAALLYADRKSKVLPNRMAAAWRTLAIACLLYAIGETIDFYHDIIQQDTFGTISDAFFLSYYPIFIVGLFQLPSRRLERGELGKLLLEMGIVIVASVQIFWVFVFAPNLSHVSSDTTWFEFTLTLAYPALDLAMLWVVITLFLRQPHSVQQGPLLLLGLSVVAMGIGDTLFNWFETVYNNSHHYWPLVAFNLSWIFAILAGILHGDSARTQLVRQEEQVRMALIDTASTRRRLPFYLPYLSVGVSFVLLVRSLLLAQIPGEPIDLLIEVIGVGIILLLVVSRQVVAFRENAALSVKLARLLEASRILASPLEIRPLLYLTLVELKNVVDFDDASIMLTQTGKRAAKNGHAQPESDTDALTLLALNYEHLENVKAKPTVVSSTHQLATVVQTGKTVILSNISLEHAQAISGFPENKRPAHEDAAQMLVSWMGIPLISRNNVIGLLVICFHRANYYTHQDASIGLTFANQTAAAIDNARLRSSERAAAATAERSRLARELHDSVSQALFGISLGAKTARQLLNDDPSRAANSIDYVVRLAAGALAEMRALIFELRPESLASEGLVNALKRQISVLSERHDLQAEIEVIGHDSHISLDVQQGLYRIALEAIQNTIKHANATKAVIRLNCENDPVVAEIQDNGRGFDTHGEFPGHLGLISMRERAEFFNGQLTIQSVPGQGTCIRVTMPRNAHGLEPIEGI